MAVVVDTSALAAVVFGETDARAYASVLAAHAGDVSVSAATVVEARIVVRSRQGSEAARDLDVLLTRISAQIVAVDEEQADLAVAAWQRFGKGRHEAGLNFGDCFAYALSRHLGVPLLYKGDDFARTDVASAL
ncbi:type II toxin-antitoxin system VapC family toxin [Microbacterium sp.]|uniref:type II toxin-antitoxin system VapC family toxin n=1 Tax=Microbacterium sp. TaxID=51671 RepID=UPI003221ACEF